MADSCNTWEFTMSHFIGRVALGIAAIVVGTLTAADPPVDLSDSGIDVLPNRTYIHRASKTYLKVPVYWGDRIADPYKLRRSTTTSVMTIDKADPRINVTITWTPLGTRPWAEVIRAAEDENLGEEYGLLLAIYGKAKVSRPTTVRLSAFTVFKILLDDGPEGPAKSAGAVYLFETGTGDHRWKVKVRAVYPQVNREEYIKQVEELIGQFNYVPEKGL